MGEIEPAVMLTRKEEETAIKHISFLKRHCLTQEQIIERLLKNDKKVAFISETEIDILLYKLSVLGHIKRIPLSNKEEVYELTDFTRSIMKAGKRRIIIKVVEKAVF